MPNERRIQRVAGIPGLWASLVLAGTLGLSGAAGAEPEAAQNPAPAAKPAATTTKKSVKPAARGAEGDKKAAAVVPPGPKSPPIVGRRDPFKLPGPPVQSAETGEAPIGNLPPGTRGLVISRLRLEGIVRLDTTSTLIAIVDTSANRAYFLRESDAVYNGVVAKITPDSVTFRENTLDSNGKVGSRDVVLRLTQGPGA